LACLALLFIAAAAGAGWFYYIQIQEDQRERLSRRLIRPDEIGFTNTVLAQTYGRWKVKGNVTNRSSHELSGFTLKIIVQDCPVSATARPDPYGWDRNLEGESKPSQSPVELQGCTTIGESDALASVSVPPNQMRSFERYLSLENMPNPTKWEWTYNVEEVRGKVK
jgi:hypothetical protein